MKLSRIFKTNERKGLSVKWFGVRHNLVEVNRDKFNPPNIKHIGKLTLFYNYQTTYVSRGNELNLNLSSFGIESKRVLEFLDSVELELNSKGCFIGFSDESRRNCWLKESLSDEGVRRLEEFVIYREKFIRGDVGF